MIRVPPARFAAIADELSRTRRFGEPAAVRGVDEKSLDEPPLLTERFRVATGFPPVPWVHQEQGVEIVGLGPPDFLGVERCPVKTSPLLKKPHRPPRGTHGGSVQHATGCRSGLEEPRSPCETCPAPRSCLGQPRQMMIRRAKPTGPHHELRIPGMPRPTNPPSGPACLANSDQPTSIRLRIGSTGRTASALHLGRSGERVNRNRGVGCPDRCRTRGRHGISISTRGNTP